MGPKLASTTKLGIYLKCKSMVRALPFRKGKKKKNFYIEYQKVYLFYVTTLIMNHPILYSFTIIFKYSFLFYFKIFILISYSILFM